VFQRRMVLEEEEGNRGKVAAGIPEREKGQINKFFIIAYTLSTPTTISIDGLELDPTRRPLPNYYFDYVSGHASTHLTHVVHREGLD
jgi:hypothetical protein